MHKKCSTTFVFLLFFFTLLNAQASLEPPDLATPSKIAPRYFGPNVFQVPEMMDGTTSSKWKAEIYSDCFFGKKQSWKENFTTDIFARLTIPLFTPRINLVIWGPLYEYSQTGPVTNKHRRVQSNETIKTHDAGDIYVSTNIHLLRQEKHWLDLSLRAALKTASGGYYNYARYYDNPGYFFDASFAKLFPLFNDKAALRVALSSGFLCWQTDRGKQNDAVMYGLLVSLSINNFTLRTHYGGYVGWECDGDAPMTLRTDVSWAIKDFSINLGYQVGFMDWPFYQLRFGIEYRFSLKNILKKF